MPANTTRWTLTYPLAADDAKTHTDLQELANDVERELGRAALYSIFGSGVDGDVTLAAPLSLTRDMHYNSLVVNGQTVDFNGYRIFVKTTLTMASGTLRANGGNASGAVAGLDTGTGSILPGRPGQSGLQAGTQNPQPFPLLGGNGGNGGAAGTNQPGLGTTNTTTNRPRTIVEAIVAMAGSVQAFYGGGGGGNGGTPDNNNYPSGGGGAGGGIVIVAARDMVFSGGSIQATGGNGGVAPGAGGQQGGGGGGGGGGALVLVYVTKSGSTPTTTLTGGTGGAGANGGSAGVAGSTGASYEFPI